MPERYEHLLFRYSSALERGDFEAVADVLREAERDPALEAMLLELNEVYAAEQTGRSNHKNPKELAMIAPLYEKRAPERVRTYNLPMVAALAVVALLGVLLATRIAPPTQWNTAQNGSPEPNVLQGVPDECAPSEANPGRIQLYTRPTEGAAYAYGAYSLLYIPQNSISVLEWLEADGETWYFVRIHDVFDEDLQGWMKEAEYVRNVRCAPLVNPDVQTQIAESMSLTGTPTPAPFEENFDMTATALIAEASRMPPTLVPLEMQGLATFTATPVPFVHPNILPTVVPAEAQTANELLICTNEARVSLEVHTEPSSESPVIVTLHAGAIFQSFQRVTQADGVRWTQVQEQVQGVTIGGGWVVMEVPDYRRIECFVSVQITGTPMSNAGDALFLPTLVPADVRGLATFTATPAPFDGSMPPTIIMPEPLAIVPTVVPFDGTMPIVDPLAVPANFPPGYGCIIETQNVVNVQDQPSNAAPVREQLPAGTPLAILLRSPQAEGDWYLVNYRTRMGSLTFGLIAANLLDVPEDCNYFGAAGELIPAAPLQTATPVPGSVIVLPPTIVSPDSIQTQDALLRASQPMSCTAISTDILNIYAGPERVGRVIFEVPAGSVLDVTAYYDQPDGRWHVVGYWAAAGVYIAGMAAPDTLTLSEACADMPSVVTYTPTPMPSLPPRLTATPTPAR